MNRDDFWTLWYAAYNGDTDAETQVNILVAKEAGLQVDCMDNHPDWSIGAYVNRGGWRDFVDVWYTNETGEEHAIPEYMSDLNAARTLPLSAPKYGNPVHVQTTEWEDQVLVEIYEEFDQNILPEDCAQCVGTHPAAVRVGAWYAHKTGQKQPAR